MADWTDANVITCSRRFTFDAGHRVFRHENKCGYLHGHTYAVEVEAEQETGPNRLDDLGRVIDFSVIKERVGGFLEKYWDHGFILNQNDLIAKQAMEIVPGQKTYYMPYNPTAENMARYLLEHICPNVLSETGVFVSKVIVQETPNCKAEARF